MNKQNGKDLTILILTYNRFEYTKITMDAVSLYTDFSCVKEVLVGDAGSTDGTRELLDTYEFVDKVYEVPYGSVANNLRRGAELATGKYIATLDNDVIVSNGWNRQVLDAMYVGVDHGIRLIGYSMPTGIHFAHAVSGDPGDIIYSLRGQYKHRGEIDCGDFALQPVWCVGGMRVAERELFISKNPMGYYLGDNALSKPGSPYFGFWYWQLSFVNQIAALLPRIPILLVDMIEDLPQHFQFAAHRLGDQEPIIEEALKCGPAKLRDEYTEKGWMRPFDFDNL